MRSKLVVDQLRDPNTINAQRLLMTADSFLQQVVLARFEVGGADAADPLVLALQQLVGAAGLQSLTDQEFLYSRRPIAEVGVVSGLIQQCKEHCKQNAKLTPAQRINLFLLLEALECYVNLGSKRTTKRHRDLFRSSYEGIIMRLIGVAHRTCKSGKDRTGWEEIHEEAMLSYFLRAGELPKYDANDVNRGRFIDRFVDLYFLNHEGKVAARNAPGSCGMKSAALLPKDIRKRLRHDLEHRCFVWSADLNKPGISKKTKASDLPFDQGDCVKAIRDLFARKSEAGVDFGKHLALLLSVGMSISVYAQNGRVADGDQDGFRKQQAAWQDFLQFILASNLTAEQKIAVYEFLKGPYALSRVQVRVQDLQEFNLGFGRDGDDVLTAASPEYQVDTENMRREDFRQELNVNLVFAAAESARMRDTRELLRIFGTFSSVELGACFTGGFARGGFDVLYRGVLCTALSVRGNQDLLVMLLNRYVDYLQLDFASAVDQEAIRKRRIAIITMYCKLLQVKNTQRARDVFQVNFLGEHDAGGELREDCIASSELLAIFSNPFVEDRVENELVDRLKSVYDQLENGADFVMFLAQVLRLLEENTDGVSADFVRRRVEQVIALVRKTSVFPDPERQFVIRHIQQAYEAYGNPEMQAVSAHVAAPPMVASLRGVLGVFGSRRRLSRRRGMQSPRRGRQWWRAFDSGSARPASASDSRSIVGFPAQFAVVDQGAGRYHDCLFCSFAAQADDMDFTAARTTAADYIAAQQDMFRLPVDILGYSLRRYVSRMRRPSTMGTLMEVIALAESTGRTVVVFSGDGMPPQVYEPRLVDAAAKPVFLYHRGLHYQAVLPRGSASVDRNAVVAGLRRAYGVMNWESFFNRSVGVGDVEHPEWEEMRMNQCSPELMHRMAQRIRDGAEVSELQREYIGLVNDHIGACAVQTGEVEDLVTWLLIAKHNNPRKIRTHHYLHQNCTSLPCYWVTTTHQ